MNELPSGWAVEPLINVLQSLRDGTHTPPKRVPEGVPLLSARNIQNGDIDLSEEYSFISKEDYFAIQRTNPISEGDVLLTIVGSIGRSCVSRTSDQFTVQRSVAIARPYANVIKAEYLSLLFRAPYFQATLETLSSGTAQRGVYLGILKGIPIPVAPLNEQSRIVTTLEKLLSRVDAAQARLATIARILKQFRKSVLSAACSGRLTADWREQDGTPEDWESAELVKVSDLIQIGPFGTQIHKADYKSNGIPLINPTHIQNNRIVHDPGFSVSKAKYEELQNYILQEDDIIMGRRGEMGRCALVSEKENGWLCGTGSLFIRPNSSVHPAFLFLILRNGETKTFLENESKGTTMSNLNLGILKRVPVSYPTLAEQREIVRRAEALFKTAEALETRYNKAQAHVDKLTPSILAKAFRGELVPQDPRDEAASVLLERIRASSAQPPTKQIRSGVRRPKATRRISAMTKSRYDDDVKEKPYLANLLRSSNVTLPTDELFKRSELPLVDFYKQLSWEVDQGHIRDNAKRLEAA